MKRYATLLALAFSTSAPGCHSADPGYTPPPDLIVVKTSDGGGKSKGSEDAGKNADGGVKSGLDGGGQHVDGAVKDAAAAPDHAAVVDAAVPLDSSVLPDLTP